jgi:hypothetical protein
MSFVKLLTAGVLAFGLVIAGATPRAHAAPAPEPEKKDDQKKDELKKDDPKGSTEKDETPLPDQYEQMLKRLADSGVPQDRIDQIRKRLQDTLKRLPGGGLPGALPNLPGGIPNLPNLPAIPGRGGRGGRTAIGENARLGAQLEKPNEALVDQFDLPKGQGQLITQVNDSSAADKAGLRAHDILLELDGKPVSSDPGEFAKQLGDIKADTPVDAVVVRKGKKETVKGISLPEEQKRPNPKGGRRNRNAGSAQG